MKLKTHIKKNKISVTTAAREAGLSRQTFYVAMRGERVSYDTAFRISRWSLGAVTLRDLGRGGAR